MVKRLARSKKDRRIERYSVGAFEDAVAPAFETVERETLPSGHRHLYHLRPR
jgi:hypothetical protein